MEHEIISQLSAAAASLNPFATRTGKPTTDAPITFQLGKHQVTQDLTPLGNQAVRKAHDSVQGAPRKMLDLFSAITSLDTPHLETQQENDYSTKKIDTSHALIAEMLHRSQTDPKDSSTKKEALPVIAPKKRVTWQDQQPLSTKSYDDDSSEDDSED